MSSVPPPAVPQLLMVYNPRFNARTIRLHVEHLRERGFVWWGRFYGGPEPFTESEARKRWPHVAALADERAKAKEASLLFVSNFVDLHVLKVTRIALGDRPPGGVREGALGYYAGRSIPLWFAVEDVRALSYDQGTTLAWFEQRLGVVRSGAQRPSGEPYTRTYDPYAAVLYHFPIVVDGPTAKEIFDDAKPPRGKKRWADADDAITSRPVQRARDELERQLVPGMWLRLREEARDLLANGLVQLQQHEKDEDVDPAMGYTRIANAIEAELCTELMGGLDGLVARLEEGRHPARAKIKRVLEAERPRDREGRRGYWTFGTSMRAIKALVHAERGTLEKMKLRKVVALAVQLDWFETIKKYRDAASHRGSYAVRPQLRKGMRQFFEMRGRILEPLLDARDEVGAWGK